MGKKPSMLMVRKVQLRVGKIRKLVGEHDYGQAESLEHDLWREVLETVADSASDHSWDERMGLASAALETAKVEIRRGWSS